jgi:hypothetical protein
MREIEADFDIEIDSMSACLDTCLRREMPILSKYVQQQYASGIPKQAITKSVLQSRHYRKTYGMGKEAVIKAVIYRAFKSVEAGQNREIE